MQELIKQKYMYCHDWLLPQKADAKAFLSYLLLRCILWFTSNISRFLGLKEIQTFRIWIYILRGFFPCLSSLYLAKLLVTIKKSY